VRVRNRRSRSRKPAGIPATLIPDPCPAERVKGDYGMALSPSQDLCQLCQAVVAKMARPDGLGLGESHLIIWQLSSLRTETLVAGIAGLG